MMRWENILKARFTIRLFYMFLQNSFYRMTLTTSVWKQLHFQKFRGGWAVWAMRLERIGLVLPRWPRFAEGWRWPRPADMWLTLFHCHITWRHLDIFSFQVDFSKEVFQEHQDACDLAGTWKKKRNLDHFVNHFVTLSHPRSWGCWRLALKILLRSFVTLDNLRYQENQRPTAAAALEHPWFQALKAWIQKGTRLFRNNIIIMYHHYIIVASSLQQLQKLGLWAAIQSDRIPRLLPKWFLTCRTVLQNDACDQKWHGFCTRSWSTMGS